MIDVKILGRMARDPEQKTLPNGTQFVTFPFATSAKSADKTLYPEIIVFGKQGETIMKYCQKGTQLLIIGVVYDNVAFISKSNSAVSKLSITLEKFEFVGSRQNGIKTDNSDMPF